VPLAAAVIEVEYGGSAEPGFALDVPKHVHAEKHIGRFEMLHFHVRMILEVLAADALAHSHRYPHRASEPQLAFDEKEFVPPVPRVDLAHEDFVRDVLVQEAASVWRDEFGGAGDALDFGEILGGE